MMRAWLVAGALFFVSCGWTREPEPIAPTFEASIAALFAERCASCHEGDAAAAGYRVHTYLDVSCSDAGERLTSPGDETAPLLLALNDATHEGILTPEEHAEVEAWIREGALARRGGVHSPGFVDPRSEDGHARMLRAERWARMLDPDREDSCGRCHDGAPAIPEGRLYAAPGATPCTSCHQEGPLACDTCHQGGAPRDPCLHPGEPVDAHAAHVQPSMSRATGLACATCHPAREATALALQEGAHGDGSVDLDFDPALAGVDARFDASDAGCDVACHARGGDTPRPLFTEELALSCQSCHTSPPAGHYAGRCDRCHQEAAADGSATTGAILHVNGQVDRGDGSGGCGACHGSGDDPWPSTGAHAAHANPSLRLPIPCETCHRVPTAVSDPAHLDAIEGAEVELTGLAAARAQLPSYAAGRCSAVACHGAGLLGVVDPEPTWTQGPSAGRCGACHGLPPPAPHSAEPRCGAAFCHGAEVAHFPDGPRITETGRASHIDGIVGGTP